FADEAKLYVPLEQAYLVSRYVGAGKKSPPLSSLGDGKWARAKIKAAASIFDYAGKMLAIQAERQMHPGYAFAPDTKWQAEFERSFPFRETPDQMKAIIDTKIDMERPRPMDRLMWRRWLWENRSGRARRIQGGHGRQTSGRARADHRSGSTTFRSVPAAHARLPGAHRNAEPLSFAIRTEESATIAARRRRRYRDWHSSAHLRRRG